MERLFISTKYVIMIQQTLVVLKPDAVKRGFIGEIITRFEKVGLHIVAMKMVRVDEALAHAHYEGIGTMITRYSDRVYRVNADFMMHGPVVAIVLEGIQAIPVVRKLAGATDPKEALPGTIRGDFAHTTRDYANSQDAWLPNLLHASANPEEAMPEIALWFKPEEIHAHEAESNLFKRGHK